VDKVRDIVGLYLNPPDHAIVLAVDERSQIQALSRTQPVLPMGLGYLEGVTHDYVRHGTTTLFAALDIATGVVFAGCRPRHRHQEFPGFLKRIDQAVPEDLHVHLMVDNDATHKHAKVRLWLAQRPRFHVHFTPASSSWLNQVERWFGLITHGLHLKRTKCFRSPQEQLQRC
jgi:putative transposase